MDATPDPTKLAAFIMPGQGSQYVSMARDLSEKYKATRDVWHETETCITQFATGQHVPFASSHPDRAVYEAYLVEQHGLDTQFRAPDTSLRRGWLTDLVLGGSQLEINRPEKAMSAILTATSSLCYTKRIQCGSIESHLHWAAGHGSGFYAALLAAGVLEPRDALCLMRYHGLEAMKCLMPHPVLFPPCCEKPINVYET